MTCHEIWMNFASFYWVKNDSPRFINTEWRDSCSYFVHTLEAQKQISKNLWKTCAESSLPWEASLFPHFPQPTHSPQASPGINSSTACDGALASGWAVGGVVGIGTCYFQPCRRTQQTSGWDISIGSYPKLCNRLWLWIMKFNASPLFIKIWISFCSPGCGETCVCKLVLALTHAPNMQDIDAAAGGHYEQEARCCCCQGWFQGLSIVGPPWGNFPYCSHTIPMSLGILMGVVWE